MKGQWSITIPKLELQDAALAVRLTCTIIEEIEFDIYGIRFGTDSRITLSYIRNSSRRFSVYIMNDLHKISLNSKCFIPGKNNPVDQCTCYHPLSS